MVKASRAWFGSGTDWTTGSPPATGPVSSMLLPPEDQDAPGARADHQGAVRADRGRRPDAGAGVDLVELLAADVDGAVRSEGGRGGAADGVLAAVRSGRDGLGDQRCRAEVLAEVEGP